MPQNVVRPKVITKTSMNNGTMKVLNLAQAVNATKKIKTNPNRSR